MYLPILVKSNNIVLVCGNMTDIFVEETVSLSKPLLIPEERIMCNKYSYSGGSYQKGK